MDIRMQNLKKIGQPAQNIYLRRSLLPKEKIWPSWSTGQKREGVKGGKRGGTGGGYSEPGRVETFQAHLLQGLTGRGLVIGGDNRKGGKLGSNKGSYW